MTATIEALPFSAFTDQWLSVDLDAWTRRVVRRHFDPVDGSPFWLARAAALPFDPRDITAYDQLLALGPFDLADLRGIDPADLVPRSVPRPLVGRIWESGGTTGSPCRVFYTRDMIVHRGVWRRWSFLSEGFEPGRAWLQATPTGPHLIGNGTWEVSELFGSLSYAIDMDPRWVKALIREGRLDEAARYTDHLVDQVADILSGGRVNYLNTTAALFRVLARNHPGLVAALDGVRLSGTQIDYRTHQRFVELLDGGICGVSYGNTFGNGAMFPVDHDRALIPYVPNFPQVTMAVVDKSDWRVIRPYGQVGQVRLTVLHDDLFLPNILERDQATRYDVGGRWPVDGVADVHPLLISQAMPEGVY